MQGRCRGFESVRAHPGQRPSFASSALPDLGTRLHRAAIARRSRQEAGSHRLRGRRAHAHDGLPVQTERELGIRVTQQRLRGLDIDALGHETGGLGATEVVEPTPDTYLSSGLLRVGHRLNNPVDDGLKALSFEGMPAGKSDVRQVSSLARCAER